LKICNLRLPKKFYIEKIQLSIYVMFAIVLHSLTKINVLFILFNVLFIISGRNEIIFNEHDFWHKTKLLF